MVLAILVLLYAELHATLRIPAIDDWLILVACPPSFALMATDNASRFIALLAEVLIVLANGIWYGFLFGIVGSRFKR
jgi:hypothetical protein